MAFTNRDLSIEDLEQLYNHASISPTSAARLVDISGEVEDVSDDDESSPPNQMWHFVRVSNGQEGRPKRKISHKALTELLEKLGFKRSPLKLIWKHPKEKISLSKGQLFEVRTKSEFLDLVRQELVVAQVYK